MKTDKMKLVNFIFKIFEKKKQKAKKIGYKRQNRVKKGKSTKS
jgi:hypothetical protein